MKIPTFNELINPVFQALKDLGNSGTIEEILNKVIENEKFTDEMLNIFQPGHPSMSKIEYNLAWARTYLKKYGALNNTSRGVWIINNNYKDISSFNPKEVVKKVKEISALSTSKKQDNISQETIEIVDAQ